MILIVDNGGDYSSHCIYFISVPDKLYHRWTTAIESLAISAVGSEYRKASIIATSIKLEWRSEDNIKPFSKLIDRYQLKMWIENGNTVPEEIASYLTAAWTKEITRR